jgi:hypothetical protein
MAIEEPLILYSRVDCHLCDQVVMMLDRAGIRWRPVDIDGDPELVRRYGIKVPVLQLPASGRELFFPFSDEQLLIFARDGEE